MSETRLDSKRALEDETEEEEEEEEEEESSEEESEEDDIGGRMMISTEKIDIKFRNYTPRDKNLKEKIIRMESKTEEGTLLDADVPDVEPQKNRKNDILGFLPPVSNLDLKNIVRPKQRILDRRYVTVVVVVV